MILQSKSWLVWLVTLLYLRKLLVASHPEITAWSWDLDWICASLQLYDRCGNAYVSISWIRQNPKLKSYILFSVQMKISDYLNMILLASGMNNDTLNFNTEILLFCIFCCLLILFLLQMYQLYNRELLDALSGLVLYF